MGKNRMTREEQSQRDRANRSIPERNIPVERRHKQMDPSFIEMCIEAESRKPRQPLAKTR